MNKEKPLSDKVKNRLEAVDRTYGIWESLPKDWDNKPKDKDNDFKIIIILTILTYCALL